MNGSALLPLLPQGETVFHGLPSQALILEALAPAIGDGLVVATRADALGVVLVRSGSLGETFAFDSDGRTSGDEASQQIRGWTEATISAWRLPDALLNTVPALLRGEPCYADLKLEWTSWDVLLADLKRRGGCFVVTVTTPAGRGVTRLEEGVHVATFTEAHPELGAPSLLDDLVRDREGTITVLHEQGDSDASEHIPSPRPAAQALSDYISGHHGSDEEAIVTAAFAYGQQPSDISSTFAQIFGVEERAAQLSDARVPDAPPSVAALLPELKLIVRRRLELSSSRIENLLDDAAARGAPLTKVAAEIRNTSIRGVMQATLEQLAEELLNVPRRPAR